jgi:hypothetical protein
VQRFCYRSIVAAALFKTALARIGRRLAAAGTACDRVLMRKIGIFAALRRRRLALSLAFGYALLLNALLGSLQDARMVAAAANPLLASVDASLCGAAGGAGQQKPIPADHQQQCPLCGPACAMGGCAPASGTTQAPLAFAAPRSSAGLFAAAVLADGGHPRAVFSSDPPSQAPPQTA